MKMLLLSIIIFSSLSSTIYAQRLGNGVNLQPSYYNGGNVNFGWSLMKTYSKIKTVRIEIEPFVSIDLAKSWIQQAVSNGYSVIASCHKATVLGSNSQCMAILNSPVLSAKSENQEDFLLNCLNSIISS
jgi:hypothetical protein